MFSRCPSCQRMDQVTQELVFKGLVTVTSESLSVCSTFGQFTTTKSTVRKTGMLR